MPSAAMRLCSSPGCGQLVPKGRCAAHQTVHYRNEERRRGTAKQRGYDADWRRLRERVLATEPLCRHCDAEGFVTAATEVDHVVPMHLGGARLDIANTQPLCAMHHRLKSAQEANARSANA